MVMSSLSLYAEDMTDDDKSGGRELGLEVAGAATRRGTRNTNK